MKEGTDLETSKAKMREHRIEKMLIVDDAFHLRGLVTFQDIEKPAPTRWPLKTATAAC